MTSTLITGFALALLTVSPYTASSQAIGIKVILNNDDLWARAFVPA